MGELANPLATLPGALWIWTGRSQIPMPFTAPAALTVRGESLLVASGPSGRIQEVVNAAVVRSFGVDRSPRPVEGSDLETMREQVQASVPEALRQDYLSALDHADRPQVLPAYRTLLPGPGESVWAQVFEADPWDARTWDVFDADGVWLGTVRMPEQFRPLQLESDRVVGVWYDDLGVEHVRAYRWRTLSDQ